MAHLGFGAFVGAAIATLLPIYSLLLLTIIPLWRLTAKRSFKFSIAFALSLGILLPNLAANYKHSYKIPEQYIGKRIEFSGYLTNIPLGQQYTVQIKQLCLGTDCSVVNKKFKLSWDSAPPMLPGDEISGSAVIKPPHSLLNPGGIDTERLDFINDIKGRGFIVKAKVRATDTWSIARTRSLIKQAIDEKFADLPYKDVLQALSIGAISQSSNAFFSTLQRTGTSHLMAISGLHVGLVALWSWLFARYLVRPVVLVRGLNAPRAGLITSIAFTVLYALLAGFTIPTQRALVMVTVFSLGFLLARRPNFYKNFALAFFVVFLLDPLCLIQGGFWLSFGAVFALGFVTVGLPNKTWLRRVLGAQFAIFIMLTPISLFLFKGSSLVAPIANIVAISWVSFITVPLTFLAILILPFASGDNLIWAWASQSVELLHHFLQFLQQLPFAYHTHEQVPLLLIVVATIGSLTMLLPSIFKLRYIGFAFWLPMLFYRNIDLEHGEFQLSMLEVGQGLAVAVHTKNHNMLYDTGPGGAYDAGIRVVVPYLNAVGVNHLDKVVVSHGDLDHAGGLDSIVASMQIDSLVSGEPHRLKHQASKCSAGERWSYDGVDFEFLHPTANFKTRNSNDRSCVLKISNRIASVLLTGDITKEVERGLVLGKVDVLQVPHHGSKTSSNVKFIESTAPDYALVSNGWYNRYGHPHKKIMQRYIDRNIEPMITTELGAIHIHAQDKLRVSYERGGLKKIWQA